MRQLLVLAVFAVVVYALVDCLRTDGKDVRGLPKPLWIVVILLTAGVGAVAWLVLGKGRGPSTPPARRGRPVAPDDDPEFLWRLEQERRRKREGGGPDSPGNTPGSTPGNNPGPRPA